MAAIRKPYFRKLYQFETISRGDYVPVKYIYPYYFVLEICFTSLEIDVVAVCLSFAVNKAMIGDVNADEFTLFFIVLTHCNNRRRVDISLHSHTLF